MKNPAEICEKKMKPFIILIAVSILAMFILKILGGDYEISLSARIGMSAMLIFTAIGHLVFADGMALMVPDFLPLKKEIVYFTGIIEIVSAAGLHIPVLRSFTAWLLIIFFILILPANIKASMEHLDFQKGTFDGNGTMYLWFRIPLQILFILWVYFSTVRI